eukprot:TRINITY_DN48161_c0_g1_i1.p1 TRINITY_DN48161_c0_g1~~TRINITY_DN48161_c0_g1_i1.p1  ORF type:complete len:255 (+),score=48.91 TRINITY_DN48161_c0_g1_i1:23-787(+)
MYRNQYDTDVTTFSPAGRLFQVEYACEAVKQGSASVGIATKDYVVIASVRRAESSLAAYTKKIYKVDDHVGVAVCGLVPDGNLQVSFLRQECMDEKWRYESPAPISRIVSSLSDKNQVYTQRNEKRPVGVGLLVAGYDYSGAHLFETSPSGNFFEYRAQAIGMRSQAAKTYLEKNVEEFAGQSLRDVILHAVRALRGTAQEKISSANISVGYVGKDVSFTVLEDEDVEEYVNIVVAEEEAEEEGGAAMVEDAQE